MLKRVITCLCLGFMLQLGTLNADGIEKFDVSNRFGIGVGGSVNFLNGSFASHSTVYDVGKIFVGTKPTSFISPKAIDSFKSENFTCTSFAMDLIYQYAVSSRLFIGARGVAVIENKKTKWDFEISSRNVAPGAESAAMIYKVNEECGTALNVVTDKVYKVTTGPIDNPSKVRCSYQLLATLAYRCTPSLEIGLEYGLFIQGFKYVIDNKSKNAIGFAVNANCVYFFRKDFSASLICGYQYAGKKIYGIKNKVKGLNIGVMGRFNM